MEPTGYLFATACLNAVGGLWVATHYTEAEERTFKALVAGIAAFLYWNAWLMLLGAMG